MKRLLTLSTAFLAFTYPIFSMEEDKKSPKRTLEDVYRGQPIPTEEDLKIHLLKEKTFDPKDFIIQIISGLGNNCFLRAVLEGAEPGKGWYKAPSDRVRKHLVWNLLDHLEKNSSGPIVDALVKYMHDYFPPDNEEFVHFILRTNASENINNQEIEALLKDLLKNIENRRILSLIREEFSKDTIKYCEKVFDGKPEETFDDPKKKAQCDAYTLVLENNYKVTQNINNHVNAINIWLQSQDALPFLTTFVHEEMRKSGRLESHGTMGELMGHLFNLRIDVHNELGEKIQGPEEEGFGGSFGLKKGEVVRVIHRNYGEYEEEANHYDLLVSAYHEDGSRILLSPPIFSLKEKLGMYFQEFSLEPKEKENFFKKGLVDNYLSLSKYHAQKFEELINYFPKREEKIIQTMVKFLGLDEIEIEKSFAEFFLYRALLEEDEDFEEALSNGGGVYSEMVSISRKIAISKFESLPLDILQRDIRSISGREHSLIKGYEAFLDIEVKEWLKNDSENPFVIKLKKILTEDKYFSDNSGAEKMANVLGCFFKPTPLKTVKEGVLRIYQKFCRDSEVGTENEKSAWENLLDLQDENFCTAIEREIIDVAVQNGGSLENILKDIIETLETNEKMLPL